MGRKAVITGLGIVSPIGIGHQRFWKAAVSGTSGLGIPQSVAAARIPAESRIVGEVKDFKPRDWMQSQIYRSAGRFSQFAIAAAKMAEEDSGLAFDSLQSDKIQVAIGTSVNGQADVAENNFHKFLLGEGVPVWAALEYPAHAATGHVAIGIRANGHTTTFASACAAGLEAIVWGARSIAQGTATTAVVGGTEAPLSDFVLEVFHSVGVLARWSGPPSQASRPFDGRRTGLVLAEGAAVVVLEQEQQALRRGARIYARVLGAASATEGVHLRKLDPSGRIVERVIQLAVRDAGVSLSDIDYICAHGNSMLDYDASETAGIKRAFGRRAWSIPVSSIKSMCGQALAASSAMQVVAATLAIDHNVVPPTINYEVPDPGCDLDYVPNHARIARLRTALVLAHSLGGAHVAMVLGSPSA